MIANSHAFHTLAILAILASQAVGNLPAPAKEEGDRILVVVNKDSIRARDLDRQIISSHVQMSDQKKSEFDYEKLLTKAVNDRLIVQEARSMDMHRDGQILKEMAGVRERLALARYLKENYRPSIKVSKQEIADTFDKYYRKFQIRTLAQPTREAAEKMMDSVRRGASMDSLARQASLDTRKYEGGLHPLKHYADIEVTLRELAENLPEGALAGPVPYRKAYTFIRLEKSHPADRTELPTYGKKMEAMLTDQKKQSSWEAFLKVVQASHPPKVNAANLARIAADSAQVSGAAYLKGDTATVIWIKGGGRITDTDFRTRVSHYVMGEGDRNYRSLMDKALNSLTAELAMAAAAKAKGFYTHPAVEAAYKRGLDSTLIEAYLREMVVKKIKFNKKEFDDYYQDHLEEFREPAQFILSEIHVSTKDSADKVVWRLKKGADFKFLAKQMPSTEKLVSSNATWVTLEAVPPEIRRRLVGLKIGEYSEAMATSGGWVIFHVDNRKKGGFKPLEESEMKIREIMFQKKFTQHLDTVLATLKTGSSITFRQDEIRKYFGKKK